MTINAPQPVKPYTSHQEFGRITGRLREILTEQQVLIKELTELMNEYSMYIMSTLAELNTDKEVEPSYKDVKDGEVLNPYLDPRA